MTEPQVWTMIGLMAGVFFGTMTLISTMFTESYAPKSADCGRDEFGNFRPGAR